MSARFLSCLAVSGLAVLQLTSSACGQAPALAASAPSPLAEDDASASVDASGSRPRACQIAFEQLAAGPGYAHLQVRNLTPGCGQQQAYFITQGGTNTWVVFLDPRTLPDTELTWTWIQFHASAPGKYWIQARSQVGGAVQDLTAVID